MLLNIDGDDLKYSCEVHHSIYSWLGPAGAGGYIGSDILALFSALNSAAAGLYSASVTVFDEILATVQIQGGQRVRVSGDASLAIPPAWGSGGFAVQPNGELTLSYLTIDAELIVDAGGKLVLENVLLGSRACVSAGEGAEVQLIGTDRPRTCSPDCGLVEHLTWIDHCDSMSCFQRDSGVIAAVCAACEQGFYNFQNNDQLGRCVDDSLTLTDAGLPAVFSAGIFTVTGRTFATEESRTVSGGAELSLVDCGGQLNSLSAIDSAFSMDASSTTTLGGSVSLSNAGAVTLQDKTFAAGARLAGTGGTQLSLSGATLSGSLSVS
eukprot:COSAG06_NODE_10963_length_1590_cov_1.409792_2_plen_322_part_01